MDLNKIYNENCLDTMNKMDDNFVDLVITSPPYDDLRDYKGYSFDFENIAKELYRVIKPGGVIVWIVGDSTKDGCKKLTPFKQALYFKDKIGFKIHDVMIYQKNAMPFPSKVRYISCFEYMFILSKGKPKTINLIKEKTRSPFKKKPAKYRGKDGSLKDFKCEMNKEYRNRWNVWKYEVGWQKTSKDKIAFQHPAIFPELLANDHIISWSNEGDLVYDPFMGSGTTAKMCILNNRNYIGSEISKEYCDIIEKRILSMNLKLF